jgi:YfiH family protein
MILPQPGAGYEWLQASWGPALRCIGLATPHLFSTRALDLRGEPDQGWQRIADELSVSPQNVVRATQVHGDSVILVESAEQSRDACASGADIVMTRNPDVAVSVVAADCVPLLFMDRASGAVAAAHAGWRGTAARVASSTVESMHEHFGTSAADLIVAVGPSIGPCCYEVGEEVVAAFGTQGRRSFYRLGDRWMLNLWTANRDQLVDAGVSAQNIHVAELCTVMHPDLFDSYRRDGARAGRMAAVIRPVA